MQPGQTLFTTVLLTTAFCGITIFVFVVERFIDLIAPHDCLQCGADGAVVCEWCLPEVVDVLPSRCYRCRIQTDDSRVCRSCRRDSRLRHVWVSTGYEGTAKQLVHDFKFERKRAAVDQMAVLMTETLPYIRPDTIVTHVPTATGRVRRRGYDHAELLAKALAHKLNLRFNPLLRRMGQTRQVGASRKERLAQLEGAFQNVKVSDIKKPVLLVDDLVTTGGTLETAARCLKRAGFRQVDAVVFAQKE